MLDLYSLPMTRIVWLGLRRDAAWHRPVRGVRPLYTLRLSHASSKRSKTLLQPDDRIKDGLTP